MKIIVRTVETPPADEGGRMVFHDRPVLVDVEIDGEWFDTSGGELEVYADSDGNEVVAVFAPQAWIFARKAVQS